MTLQLPGAGLTLRCEQTVRHQNVKSILGASIEDFQHSGLVSDEAVGKSSRGEGPFLIPSNRNLGLN